MRVVRRSGLAILIALVALAVTAGEGAGAAGGPGYADSVDRALQIVRSVPDGDRTAATEAATVLEAGAGQSQPEIAGDLRADPPRLGDARLRLLALSAAIHGPAFTPEPARADRAVHQVLAQSRYAGLRAAPSPADRLGAAFQQALAWLVRHLASSSASAARPWLVMALAALALVLLMTLAGLLAPSLRSHRTQRRGKAVALAPEPVRDRFAEARRLAARGDLTAAVRQLAGGVCAALGDSRDWDVSPLTVREIFSRAPDPAALRPLLLAFEAAVYGDHAPDRGAYERADAAAARFRTGRQERAA